jgi:hypothetical protein
VSPTRPAGAALLAALLLAGCGGGTPRGSGARRHKRRPAPLIVTGPAGPAYRTLTIHHAFTPGLHVLIVQLDPTIPCPCQASWVIRSPGVPAVTGFHTVNSATTPIHVHTGPPVAGVIGIEVFDSTGGETVLNHTYTFPPPHLRHVRPRDRSSPLVMTAD